MIGWNDLDCEFVALAADETNGLEWLGCFEMIVGGNSLAPWPSQGHHAEEP